MRELILYATPTGALARTCATYFDTVEPTTAQTYPPHVTLTGFFHRRDVSPAVDAAAAIGDVPADAVDVKRLMCTDEWVGLEVESAWMEAVAARFADAVPAGPDEDDVRLKQWLHLSLAYGFGDLREHAAQATRDIDPHQGVGWEIALWERSDGDRWDRLT